MIGLFSIAAQTSFVCRKRAREAHARSQPVSFTV
jgi:hypothetical protein